MRLPVIGELSLSSPLKKNFAAIFVSNVIYALCLWGVLVALARLGSPKIVGQFSLGLAISAPITMFFMMQLRAVLVTDVKNEYTFSEYFGLRIVTTLLALAVIIITALLLNYEITTTFVIIAVGITKGVEAIEDILYGVMQKNEKMHYIAVSRILRGIMTVASAAVVMYITGNIIYAVIAYGACWLLVTIFYDIRMAGKFTCAGSRALLARLPAQASSVSILPKIDMSKFWKLTKTALPLGIVMVLISANARVGYIILSKYWGEEAVGFYGAIAYFLIGSQVVLNSLGFALTPVLAKAFIEDIKHFKSIVIKMLLLMSITGIILLVGIILFGWFILEIAYGVSYVKYYTVFNLFGFIIILTLGASVLGYSMTAARKFKVQVPIFMFVLGANIISSFLLIPKYSLHGAAIAMGISCICQFLFSLLVIINAVRSANINTKG
jgi:O-antigen/teichoic acid export membrane protein